MGAFAARAVPKRIKRALRESGGREKSVVRSESQQRGTLPLFLLGIYDEGLVFVSSPRAAFDTPGLLTE